MLFREELAVYCEKHMEHNNTLCAQNVEFLYKLVKKNQSLKG
jgi:hypothetical protein